MPSCYYSSMAGVSVPDKIIRMKPSSESNPISRRRSDEFDRSSTPFERKKNSYAVRYPYHLMPGRPRHHIILKIIYGNKQKSSIVHFIRVISISMPMMGHQSEEAG